MLLDKIQDRSHAIQPAFGFGNLGGTGLGASFQQIIQQLLDNQANELIDMYDEPVNEQPPLPLPLLPSPVSVSPTPAPVVQPIPLHAISAPSQHNPHPNITSHHITTLVYPPPPIPTSPSESIFWELPAPPIPPPGANLLPETPDGPVHHVYIYSAETSSWEPILNPFPDHASPGPQSE